MSSSSRMETLEVLRVKLAVLKREHSDLDAAISAMQVGQTFDALSVQRLKKQKLSLKDEIATLEDQMTPDIIA